MKNTLIIIFLALNFQVMAQNFEKNYPFWEEAGGDAILSYNDGYVLMGFGARSYQDNYLFIIRTDLNGDTLWTKQLDVGNTGISLGYISSYAKDNAGNIYLSPVGADSANLIKLSGDWDIIWMRKYDPEIEIMQIEISRDNNLFITGTNSLNEHRLLKTDPDGNIIWQSVPLPHASWQNALSYAPSVLEMENDNIVLISVLSTMIESHACDIYYLTKEGDTISSNSFPWVLSNAYAEGDELISIAHHENMGNWEDNLLVKFQTDGTVLCNRPLNFGTKDVSINQLLRKPDKELVVVGTSQLEYPNGQEIILHGMSETGDSLWTSLPMSSYEIWPYDIALCNNGGYVVTGYSGNSGGKYAPFLLKTDSLGIIGNVGIHEYNDNHAISVYPNPAFDYVVFENSKPLTGTIAITDITGRPVAEMPVSGQKTVWNTSEVAPGVYLYRIENNGNIQSGKALIAR